MQTPNELKATYIRNYSESSYKQPLREHVKEALKFEGKPILERVWLGLYLLRKV